MFYILHKRKLLPIDPDRIYTFAKPASCWQKPLFCSAAWGPFG